jgi:hypothetical protein
MADTDPNKLFRAKLGDKPTLRLLLSKKDEDVPIESDPKTNRRRHLGTTYRRRPQDELYMKRKQQQGLTLNFWDLGQIKIGEDWMDLDFTYTPGVPVDSNGKPTGTMQFGTTGWDQMKAKIFEVDLVDFDTMYRKFTYERAERYGVDVYTGDLNDWAGDHGTLQEGVGRANSRWQINEYTTLITGTKWISGQGFVYPTAQDQVSIITQSGFVGWGFITDGFRGNSPDYKLTLVDDPGGPPATIEWSGHIDAFLVPRPMCIINSEQSFVSGVLRYGYMGLLFAVQSRDLWLDNPNMYAYWQSVYGPPAIGGFSYDWIGAVHSGDPVLDEGFNEYGSYLDATYHRVLDNVHGTTASPLLFPLLTGESGFAAGGQGTADFPTVFSLGMKAKIYENVLIAMLRKNGTWYYMWSTQEIDPASHILTGFGWSITP